MCGDGFVCYLVFLLLKPPGYVELLDCVIISMRLNSPRHE